MAKITIDGSRAQTARTVLLAAFAAIAVVLLGALGLHKLKSRGLVTDLPGKLGADVSQTANGFTYSQSQRGHTLFTIHASRIVQFKGDLARLQDVSITLYGPEGSHRQDHIAGSAFTYDKKSGVIAAAGSVLIDLQSPGSSGSNIHVETSGVRFDQKSGQVDTPQPLAFTVARGSGKAVGGSYDSKSGVLVLQSAVELRGEANGEEAVTYADHAQLLRDSRTAYLLHARSLYEGNQSSANQAILHFRPDGTLEHVDAEDHVRVQTAGALQLSATNLAVALDGRSEPVSAFAGGGVNFTSASGPVNLHGNAVESTMSFIPGSDGKPVLHHANFNNAVSLVLQQRSLGGDPRGSATREMTASELDIDFAPGANGQVDAQTARASGGAKVDMHDLPYGAPPTHTAIFGQQLTAQLADGRQLKQLDGTGGTKVIDYAPDGAADTSTGDTLRVNFLPLVRARTVGKSGAVGAESAVIDTAVQNGRVTLAIQPARDAKTKTGAPQQPFIADADTAAYHASDGLLRLTGDPAHPPRVHSDTWNLTAAEVMYRRNSGEVRANGDVRSTYLQGSSGVPTLGGTGAVHIVADGAEFQRDTGAAVFTGDGAKPARLWQGANSVTAPELDLAKGGGTLSAHGADGSRDAVHAVFTGDNGTARITAGSALYADSTRTAEFRGGVTSEQPNGTVRAEQAQLFLSEPSGNTGSKLERLVASGHVLLTQPGRRGSGEKLVYTAADGNYLLTGTSGAPPRASDADRGATTGAALLFNGSNQTVEVLNSDSAGANRRTVTDTRAPR